MDKQINLKKIQLTIKNNLTLEDLVFLALEENTSALAMLLYRENVETTEYLAKKMIAQFGQIQVTKKDETKAFSVTLIIAEVKKILQEKMGKAYKAHINKAHKMAEKLIQSQKESDTTTHSKSSDKMAKQFAEAMKNPEKMNNLSLTEAELNEIKLLLDTYAKSSKTKKLFPSPFPEIPYEPHI